jgi:hypothetical protein
MYCPTCGAELIIHDNKEEDMNNGDESLRCTCPKGCWQAENGTGLTFHHPIYGIKAAPGDSWSLSWIK